MAARPEEVESFNNITTTSTKGRRARRRRRQFVSVARNLVEGAGQVTDFVARQSERLAPDTEWYKDQATRDWSSFYC